MDHRNQQVALANALSEFEQRLDDQIGSTYRSTRAHDVILHARSRQRFPDDQDDVWEFRLIEIIRDVWRDRENIDEYENHWTDPNPSLRYCHDAMAVLGFETAAEYFVAARKFIDEPELWPEVHDESLDEYKSLRKFIEDSLPDENATQWEW